MLPATIQRLPKLLCLIKCHLRWNHEPAVRGVLTRYLRRPLNLDKLAEDRDGVAHQPVLAHFAGSDVVASYPPDDEVEDFRNRMNEMFTPLPQ